MLQDRLRALLPGARGSAAWIRRSWELASSVPGGRKIYNRFLGAAIPYTGSIGAEVLSLEDGFALVRMRDHRFVRNHLGSVHAIALCNLAELTGNAALASALPDDARFIVTRLDMRYLKKARGAITASCHTQPSFTSERQEVPLSVELHDEDGVLVARADLYSLIGPLKS